MRFLVPAALCIMLLLSGCASLFAEPSPGMDHLSGMQQHAASRLDNARFLGMAGVEGRIDIDAFIEMAKEEIEEEEEDASILDQFEFRFQNGELGDGRTGSWFGLFDEPGKDRYLVVQSVAGGMRSHLFDFEGEETVDAEDAEPTQPGLGPLGVILDQLKAGRRASSTVASCDDVERTNVPAGINSDKAARIAMEQPIFRNHTELVPDGDFVYLYMPEYTYCWDDETETQPAVWAIGHMDIDLLLEDIEPRVAYVIINATDGAVLDADVEIPLEWTYHHIDITVTGGLLFPPLAPAASTANPLTVPAGAVSLQVWIANLGGEMTHWFTDPAGKRFDVEAFGGSGWLTLDDPEAGKWTLHSQFDHQPLESRRAAAEITIVSEQQAQTQ